MSSRGSGLHGRARVNERRTATSARSDKGLPRRLVPVGHLRDERLLDPYAAANPHALKVLYGDDQIREALSRYSGDALRASAEVLRHQYPGTKPGGTSKVKLIDYLATHAAGDESVARSFADVSKQIPGQAPTERRTRAASARSTPPKPVKPGHIERVQANKLTVVGDVPEHLLDPYAPPNPHALHILYGEGQLRAALDRYTASKLRDAARVMRRQFPDHSVPRAKASKAQLVEYLAASARGDLATATDFLRNEPAYRPQPA